MMADPRSRALVNNFASQWLHLRNLDSMTPDMRLFPDFDENLRQAFRTETELFFDSVLREDRSAIDRAPSWHAPPALGRARFCARWTGEAESGMERRIAP